MDRFSLPLHRQLPVFNVTATVIVSHGAKLYELKFGALREVTLQPFVKALRKRLKVFGLELRTLEFGCRQL